MRNCPYCSTENATEAQYCRGCGRPLEEPASTGQNPFAAKTEVWSEEMEQSGGAPAVPPAVSGGFDAPEVSASDPTGARPNMPTSQGNPAFESTKPPGAFSSPSDLAPPAPPAPTLSETVVGKSTADGFREALSKIDGPDPNVVTSVEQLGGPSSGAFGSEPSSGPFGSDPSTGAPPPPAGAFGGAVSGSAPAPMMGESGAHGVASGAFGASSGAPPAMDPSGAMAASGSMPAPEASFAGGAPQSEAPPRRPPPTKKDGGGAFGWFAGGCALFLLLGMGGSGYLYVTQWTGDEVAATDGDDSGDTDGDDGDGSDATNTDGTDPVDGDDTTDTDGTDTAGTDGDGSDGDRTDTADSDGADTDPVDGDDTADTDGTDVDGTDTEPTDTDGTDTDPVDGDDTSDTDGTDTEPTDTDTDTTDTEPVDDGSDTTPDMNPDTTRPVDPEPGTNWERRARAALRAPGQACFRDHVGADGTVTVLVNVQNSGRVAFTRVQSNTTGRSSMGQCISGALVGRSVPAPPGGRGTFTMSFTGRNTRRF